MKTYLITGGAGFIGSNHILYLYKKHGDTIRIINVDSLTYAGNLENLKAVENAANYAFIKADVCDGDALELIFSENEIDYIIHFAAESHVDRSIETPEIFARTNVLGTVNLLNAAKKHWQAGAGFAPVKKFVHISTDEVYGSLGETGYFTEQTPLDPHSPYSASKAAADMLVKSYWDTYGLPINITRCSNNYGPYQFPEKLIPLFINNALEGKPLPVYGDGKNIRDWLYVEDHAKAVDIVTENGRPGEVYNIGGHNEMLNIDIVNMLLDTLLESLPENDKRRPFINKSLIKFVEDRLGHDRRYAIDSSKIRRELGWSPDTMFKDGIRKTVKWYIENESWAKNIESAHNRK